MKISRWRNYFFPALWYSGRMNRMTWSDAGMIFEKLAQVLMQEWNCEPPPPNQIAAPVLKAECDRWCQELARRIDQPLDAPEYVRPWILQRVIAAKLFCDAAAEQGAPMLPTATPANIAAALFATLPIPGRGM
jgi:hypothetical protein